jgi:hypothetical protein
MSFLRKVPDQPIGLYVKVFLFLFGLNVIQEINAFKLQPLFLYLYRLKVWVAIAGEAAAF